MTDMTLDYIFGMAYRYGYTDLDDCNLSTLENAQRIVKTEIQEVDNAIDELLKIREDTSVDGWKEYRRAQKRLEGLGNYRYSLSRLLGKVESAAIKKRRAKYANHSQHAMNHGGVYTYGHDIISNQSGRKFRGWKGISL